MGRINWRSVFLCGLLWGLIAILLAAAAAFLYIRRELIAALEAVGRPLQETLGLGAFWLALFFAAGILAMWLYAAIRPRYGPGPKTAAVAGLAFWLIRQLTMLAVGALGLFPWSLIVLDSVTYLVIIMVATVIAARPYKE